LDVSFKFFNFKENKVILSCKKIMINKLFNVSFKILLLKINEWFYMLKKKEKKKITLPLINCVMTS